MAYQDPTKKRSYARAYYHRNRDRVRAARREHRQAHQGVEVARNAKLRREKRLWLVEVLGGQCIDCGEMDERALDVHHPNGKDRPLLYQWSWERIKAEAMVTILLCSTCHRRKHKPK